MATKYCEFEPSQHRNKRVAFHVFLDDESDPHPLAICDVCAKKLKQMRPGAIVLDRKEFEAKKKASKQGAAPAGPPEGGEAGAPAEAADAVSEAEPAGEDEEPQSPVAPSSKTE